MKSRQENIQQLKELIIQCEEKADKCWTLSGKDYYMKKAKNYRKSISI